MEVIAKVRMEGTMVGKEGAQGGALWVADQVQFLDLSDGYKDTNHIIIH